MLNKLDADDDWRVNIVWTDIKEAGGHNDIEKAGLSELSEQGGSGPGSYIYVKPGQTPGNVLIEIKSGKIKGNPLCYREVPAYHLKQRHDPEAFCNTHRQYLPGKQE